MHTYSCFIVGYTALALLCSSLQLHAADKPVIRSRFIKMHVPAACRKEISEYNQDVIASYAVLQEMLKDLAKLPGLKPSNLLDFITPEEFIYKFRGLKQIEASSVYAFYWNNQVWFDATFEKVLAISNNPDSAWLHVDDHLQEKILELSKGDVQTIAVNCAKPAKPAADQQYYLDASLLLSASQLQGVPTIQITEIRDR